MNLTEEGELRGVEAETAGLILLNAKVDDLEDEEP